MASHPPLNSLTHQGCQKQSRDHEAHPHTGGQRPDIIWQLEKILGGEGDEQPHCDEQGKLPPMLIQLPVEIPERGL